MPSNDDRKLHPAVEAVCDAIHRERIKREAGIDIGPTNIDSTKPTPNCLVCVHCESYGEHGHVCQAPVPAWAQSACNDAIPIIEDAEHDATMAERCELFDRRRKIL